MPRKPSLKRRAWVMQMGQALDREKLVKELAEYRIPMNQARCQLYLIELVERAREIQSRKLEKEE